MHRILTAQHWVFKRAELRESIKTIEYASQTNVNIKHTGWAGLASWATVRKWFSRNISIYLPTQACFASLRSPRACTTGSVEPSNRSFTVPHSEPVSHSVSYSGSSFNPALITSPISPTRNLPTDTRVRPQTALRGGTSA